MRELVKPLYGFTAKTDELKQLIKKYPDYPIVVICNSDVVCDDYGWWYAPDIRFSVGEILDCYAYEINDEKVYTDRDDFYEDVQYHVENYDNLESMTDEEFEKEIQRIMQKYEPYWKKVITIIADV